MKTRILAVASDASLRATIARALLRAGYAVELAEGVKHAREVLANEGAALAILAPHGMGAAAADLAREFRDKNTRLIVITESGDAALDGLPLQPGACIARPFTEQDLVAKVKSEIKSELDASPAPAPEPGAVPAAVPADAAARDLPQVLQFQVLQFEGYTLDAGARTCVGPDGREVTLTRAEFSLALAFARQPGRVLTRDELSHVVAGRGAEPDDRSVDVLISRLRRKIERDPKTPRLIVTMPGEGYRFTARPVSPDPSELKTIAPPPVEARQATTDHAPPDHPQRAPVATRIGRPRVLAIAGAVIAIVLVAIAGWTALQMRTVSREMTKVVSAAAPPAATSPAASKDDPSRRAAVYRRMVAAMQDDRFNWRTVERLAIESGVDESVAHEILAEHPDEVVLGKSHEGKLLAKLAER
jgi:DNA-binding response OmpR family regulator